VNPLKPDYEKFPALEKATGYETILQHGETLFIPTMWWHYIAYIDGGFSLSLRARDGLLGSAKGLFHIAQHFVVDKGMNVLMARYWKSWKEEQAQKRARIMMNDQ
jgi:Cupin-like domain